MRLRSHLLVLVLAAVVPLVVFTSFLVRHDLASQRAVLDHGLRETARALSLAVDREVRTSWAVLETLAASAYLQPGDLRAFHALCVRTIEGRPGAWIVLFDRSGQQVVNSSRPFGSPLPNPFRQTRPAAADPRYPHLPLGGAAPVRTVFATEQPVVSDLFVALDSREPTIGVAVPVVRGGHVRYALEMSIDPRVFTRLLADQRLPPDSGAGIFDSNGFIITRIIDASRFVGHPVPADFAAQIARADEGSGIRHTLEGTAVYHAFTRSKLTGWTTATGTSQAVADASANRAIALLAGGAAAAFLVGLSLALVVGRRITRPISTLADSAGALTRGERVAVDVAAVDEVRELHRALLTAGEAIREGTAERERRLVADARRMEAQAANQAKDEFLAMLGHELRNPLGAIASAASLLNLPGAPEPAAQRARAVIARQIQHLSRLVDDLLDVSRATSGKVVLVRRRLDLAELVAGAVNALRSSGRLDRHEVSVAASPAWVDADETRLEQVVSNLLGNALKYTPPGGAIAVRVRGDGDMAVLDIADTGIGIPSHLTEKIFDLFVQGERGLDRTQGGLGIGLTLVKMLVEAHGGTVAATSEGPGRGATFTVRLPAVPAPSAPSRAVAPSPSTPTRRRVVIVEDNDDAREMLRFQLVRDGHEVHEAADGQQGVDLIVEVAPDVALIDVGLPIIDGYEVARRIRARTTGRSMLLVALTGYGQVEDRRRAQDAGFDVHLTKPVLPEHLAEIVGGSDANPRSRDVRV